MLRTMTIVLLGTFDPHDDGGLHGLIRRFRAGDPDACAAVARGALDALRGEFRQPPAAVLVPVPGHEPGSPGGQRLALAREIARALGWALPEPVPLRRVHAVPPAKAGGSRDATAAAASLAWDDGGAGPGSTIVLFDDVLATGGTIDASVAAIRRDGGHAREIRVLVLARAVAGPVAGTPAGPAGAPTGPPRRPTARRTGPPARRA